MVAIAGPRPALWTALDRRLVTATWLAAVGLIYLTLMAEMYHGDAFMYWQSGVAGYPTTAVAGFVYPPPAKLLFSLAQYLPYPVFYAGWLALLMAVMRWMMGPWLMLAFILPPVVAAGPFLGWNALASGNVSLLIGAGIAYGVERPAGFLVPALTKVTPAIGLGWFLLRREWRHLATALVAIGLVCLASFLIAPELWPQWLHVMALNAGTTAADQAFTTTTVPPLLRIAVAGLIVVLAAWRDAAWALPVAGFYAIGWLGDTSMLVMLGSVRLLRVR